MKPNKVLKTFKPDDPTNKLLEVAIMHRIENGRRKCEDCGALLRSGNTTRFCSPCQTRRSKEL